MVEDTAQLPTPTVLCCRLLVLFTSFSNVPSDGFSCFWIGRKWLCPITFSIVVWDQPFFLFTFSIFDRTNQSWPVHPPPSFLLWPTSWSHTHERPQQCPTQQQLMKHGKALASKIARPPCLSGFLASIYPHQRHSYICWLQIHSPPKPLFHSIMPPVPSEWQWEFPLYPMKSYVVNQWSESLSETNV